MSITYYFIEEKVIPNIINNNFRNTASLHIGDDFCKSLVVKYYCKVYQFLFDGTRYSLNTKITIAVYQKLSK